VKLESVRKLWTDKNTGGSLDLNGKRNVLATFAQNGKQYKYQMTLVAFAARFDLIPQVDVVAESKAAIRALENGQVPAVHTSCSDTILAMWGNRNDTIVKYTDAANDDFDRAMIRCEIISRASDPWLV